MICVQISFVPKRLSSSSSPSSSFLPPLISFIPSHTPLNMIVSKRDRLAVYSFLFKEGIIVAKKDITIEHGDLKLSNLIVVKLMLSLKTRGYVRENFCWAHHYFYLTDEGIVYLREYLHLPEEIIPATLKKAAPAARPVGARQPQEEGAGKDAGAPGEYKPSFRREGPPRAGGGGAEAGRRDFKGRS